MPIINCPECGKQVSDRAVQCPNCGFGVNSFLLREKQIAKAQDEAHIEAIQYVKYFD